MSINKAIENIFEGRLDEMRQNFSAALTSKAVDKLEERKIQIAENYFGQVDESDLPITKQKKKTYTYKHKTSGKEISAVEAPGKDWEKINEEQLDEKVIGRSKKGNVRIKMKSDGTGKAMSGKRKITDVDSDRDDADKGGIWVHPRKKKSEKGDRWYASGDEAAKSLAKKK